MRSISTLGELRSYMNNYTFRLCNLTLDYGDTDLDYGDIIFHVSKYSEGLRIFRLRFSDEEFYTDSYLIPSHYSDSLPCIGWIQ